MKSSRLRSSSDGAEYLVDSDYRDKANAANGWRSTYLPTEFERIIQQAGLTPWPRLFQAMRASRETDLAKEHSVHATTAWIGITLQIALKHCVQETDTDFA